VSILPLNGIRLLVVEDDPLIALDIESTLEEAGAIIGGSARTVAQALAIINDVTIEAAVLDYRLETETSAAVADHLLALGVPFLFHTSSGGAPSEKYPWVTIVAKPSRSTQLVEAIKALTSSQARGG
jgi:DNA-binding NtrC family response regulator